MIPETSSVTIGTPHGALYVAVIAAKEDSFHDSERGYVTDTYPRVRVASDPTFEADPGHTDHWTIRGRAYAVHRTVYLHDLTHIEYGNGSNGGRWQWEDAPHRGGFRNDRRSQVEVRTKTWDLMRDVMHAALDEFAKTNDGWEAFSRYLLLKNKFDREIRETVDLRAQAAKHEATADKLAGEMAPVLEAVPDSLRSLLRD